MSQLSRFFRVAPFDLIVFLTTLISVGVLAYFVVAVVSALAAGQYPDTFDLLGGVLLALVVGFTLLRSVKGYRLQGNDLVIERRGPGRVHIALSEIAGAEASADLGQFVRSGFLSSQGLFGWAGRVNVRKPTDTESLLIEVYGTNPANAVLLSLKNDSRLIVTPRDVQGFVDALRESGVGEKPLPVARSYIPPARKKKAKK